MSTDQVMGQAFDLAVHDLDRLIARRFAGADRTLVVERESVKHWVARIDDDVLFRSPDGSATLRFAHTFASRNAGVRVQVVKEYDAGYSMRIDNVVPIGINA